MNPNKRFAVLIILVTNAIIISFLESFIPIPAPVPGIKLGLGNIITMIAIAFLPLRDVLAIVVIRCFVVAVLTRGVMMLAFSLSGGIISALVMWFLYKKLNDYFSVKGISIAGAIIHNLTQLTVASFILGQIVVFYYLPVLMVSAVITGLITGTIGELTINEMEKREVFTSQKGLEGVGEGSFVKYSFSAPIHEEPKGLPLDSGIKLILAIALMIIPFYIQNLWSIGIFIAYLLLITFVLKVNFRTLLISGASFAIIVLFPYFFGLSLNAVIYHFTQNEVFALQGAWAIFNRILKLFVIWYLSIIYFQTTPMTSFLGMLDKLTIPFKKIGLSIENYLKVIMCIVILLKAMGNELKENLGQKMRTVMGEKKGRFSINVKGIAQLIVNLILDSFSNLDTIEEYVDRVKPEDLYHYKLKLTLKDGFAILSFTFLIAGIWMLERV